MSLPEVLLWRYLKTWKAEGFHVRKQHPAGPYVLDFYCAERKLAIEVDGYSHTTEDRPERDERRDAWLLKQGVSTLRLRAQFVLSDMDGALHTIRSALAERPLPPRLRRGPPPPKGEDLEE